MLSLLLFADIIKDMDMAVTEEENQDEQRFNHGKISVDTARRELRDGGVEHLPFKVFLILRSAASFCSFLIVRLKSLSTACTRCRIRGGSALSNCQRDSIYTNEIVVKILKSVEIFLRQSQPKKVSTKRSS